MAEDKGSPGWFGRGEVDLGEVVEGKFKAGEGMLLISLDMPDAAILLSVRHAVSFGKPFTVIPGGAAGLAAARSVGVHVIEASQDVAAFQKAPGSTSASDGADSTGVAQQGVTPEQQVMLDERKKYAAEEPTIKIYSSDGGRVMAFGGLLTGLIAAREGEPNWYRGFVLAEQLGVQIQPAYGYAGSLEL